MYTNDHVGPTKDNSSLNKKVIRTTVMSNNPHNSTQYSHNSSPAARDLFPLENKEETKL